MCRLMKLKLFKKRESFSISKLNFTKKIKKEFFKKRLRIELGICYCSRKDRSMKKY